MRFAFLTTEFVTEVDAEGGLANYLHRMARALGGLGHEVEVFVISRHEPGVLDHGGIRVERVGFSDRWGLGVWEKLAKRALGRKWLAVTGYVRGAAGLASALERRHAVAPFDVVQSPNCGASGLFVRRRAGRRHLLRLSSDHNLWWETDGKMDGFRAQLLCWLERACRRRADVVYAPSRFLAAYCRSRWGCEVLVARPPVLVESEPAERVEGYRLPGRYLMHFGQIGKRKGSDTLARALELAWRAEPGLEMVWAGREIRGGTVSGYRARWGEGGSRVHYLGAVPKRQLYAMLLGAEAAVLPSVVDNLPNTVIESLMFGVPVIGTAGASVDELVEDGRTGELVAVDDAEGLAAALVRAWRGEASWHESGVQRSRVLSEMSPERAAAALLELAGAGEEVGVVAAG